MNFKTKRLKRNREHFEYKRLIMQMRDLFRDAQHELWQRGQLENGEAMKLIADAMHDLMNTETACYVMNADPQNPASRAKARNIWEITIKKLANKEQPK
jgi:hypothetical protein